MSAMNKKSGLPGEFRSKNTDKCTYYTVVEMKNSNISYV